MNDELQSVKNKVRKLLALGSGNNSTAEAKVAMERAGQLMDQWALSIEDVELDDEKIIHKCIDTGRKNKPEFNPLTPLADFCNVKLWVTPPARRRRVGTFGNYAINIIGYETDIQIFEYFWNMIVNTLEAEYERFKQTAEGKSYLAEYHGRQVRASFRNGFVSEVNNKLDDLSADAMETQVTKSGTALVPLKNGKVEAYFDEHFDFKLTSTRSYNRSGGTGASYAGRKAGQNVSFSKGVGAQGGSVKQLGR